MSDELTQQNPMLAKKLRREMRKKMKDNFERSNSIKSGVIKDKAINAI